MTILVTKYHNLIFVQKTKSLLVYIYLHVSITHFRFELQQAKIFVSKLKCDPYDDPVLGDRLDDIDEKIEKLENASFPLLSPYACPVSKSSKFKLVDNVCYYFEHQTALKYRDAQQNCKVIFGPHGHLFEPETPERVEKYTLLLKL